MAVNVRESSGSTNAGHRRGSLHSDQSLCSRLSLATFRENFRPVGSHQHQHETPCGLYFINRNGTRGPSISNSWASLPEEYSAPLQDYDNAIATSEKASILAYRVLTEQGHTDWVAVKMPVSEPANSRRAEQCAAIKHEFHLLSHSSHNHLIATTGNFKYRSANDDAVGMMLYPLAPTTLEKRFQRLDASAQSGGTSTDATLAQRFKLLDQAACLVDVVRYLHDGHRLGCIKHRDIKPENILLDADDNMVLADLDIALSFGDRDQAGTQGFSANTETFANAKVLYGGDARRGLERDINSLGYVLSELATVAFGVSRQKYWGHCYAGLSGLSPDISGLSPDISGLSRPLYGNIGRETIESWLVWLENAPNAPEFRRKRFHNSAEEMHKFLHMVAILFLAQNDDRRILKDAWEVFNAVTDASVPERCRLCSNQASLNKEADLQQTHPGPLLPGVPGSASLLSTNRNDLDVAVNDYTPSVTATSAAWEDMSMASQALEDGDSQFTPLLNDSGNFQEQKRSFGLWSICAVSIVADNAWGIGSGALVVALYNGGGPGVLFGLLAATIFYGLIGACLAELGSAMPCSSNVFYWARVTAGQKYGLAISFFAGWWNFLAWTFGTAAPAIFGANALIAIWTIWHPDDYSPQRWHAFLAYAGVILVASTLVITGQRYIAPASSITCGICLISMLTSVLVIVSMTANNGAGYASNYSVWQDFQNLTGWQSAGFVFLMGMVNGAFAIGTPDGACHLLEETQRAKQNLPLSILAQLSTGFATTFLFYIALLYGINDYSSLFNDKAVTFPLAAIYQQATNNTTATTILLVVYTVNLICCLPGAYVASGRMLWILARDGAAPGSRWLDKIDINLRTPFRAQLIVTLLLFVLGGIYVGSVTAFYTFVGVFCILTTASYAAAILPNMITMRQHTFERKGPFWMPAYVAYPVMAMACAYICIFSVIYMVPSRLAVNELNMNYSSVIAVGCTLLIALLYVLKRRHGYTGPYVLPAGQSYGDVELNDIDQERLLRLDENERQQRLRDARQQPFWGPASRHRKVING